MDVETDPTQKACTNFCALGVLLVVHRVDQVNREGTDTLYAHTHALLSTCSFFDLPCASPVAHCRPSSSYPPGAPPQQMGVSSNGGGTGSGRRFNRGRWTRQEHEQFLRGLEAVGEVWCLVSTYVPTRTELQVRTHAQKYFRKVRQGLPFPEEVRTCV